MRKRLLIVPILAIAMAGLAYSATATTGANFTDTKTGTITGQIASVGIVGSGGSGANNLDISFATPLVPGTPQSVSTSFRNSGNVAEDIYLVFNTSPALHAINQLGTLGTAVIAVNGRQVFASGNLEDGLQLNGGGPFVGCPNSTGICPIPTVVPFLTNVVPGGVNAWTFTFGYSVALNNVTNHNFNPYPVNSAGRVDVNSISNGLPYSLVAVPAGNPAPVLTPSV